MTGKYAFVMMTKEKWWNRFRRNLHEGKHAQSYVQRGEAPPKQTSIILFYVTKPVAEIAGHAEFIERKVGDVLEVWKKYGSESVLKSEQEYRELVGDKRQASFIRFKNLREATNTVPLADVLMLLGARRLSRKGFYLDKETADKIVALME
jgi:predicted transcriptional regulator